MVYVVLVTSLGFLIFFIGMKLMELALFKLGGDKMLSSIEKATRTPLHGLTIGTLASATLQSSTAVTLLAISFVNGKLIPFSRTFAIILGTNIGTCLTTILIGLNLLHFSKPIMIITVIIWIMTIIIVEFKQLPRLNSAKVLKIRQLAIAMFGFAVIIEGIKIMRSVGHRLEESTLFDYFINSALESPIIGLIVGAILTALIHSSAAVIAMTMSLAATGVMPMEVCIAIVLGSNIGTCATALLVSLTSSKGGKLVAYSHLFLNVAGAMLFYPFIDMLVTLSSTLSDSLSMQVAHIQTIFNVVCSLLALPICYLPFMKRWD